MDKYLASLVIVGFLLAFTACGYQVVAEAPIDMPGGISKLYLEGVENPTTEIWLDAELRKEVREEFIRRGQVKWVNKPEAKGYLNIEVLRFTSSAKLENAEEQTVRSEVVLILRGRIIGAQKSDLLWDSGEIAVRESHVGDEGSGEEREAQKQAVEEIVEELADTLSRDF